MAEDPSDYGAGPKAPGRKAKRATFVDVHIGHRVRFRRLQGTYGISWDHMGVNADTCKFNDLDSVRLAKLQRISRSQSIPQKRTNKEQKIYNLCLSRLRTLLLEVE